MTEKESALHSQYIIDGIKCDTTPAELLAECSEEAMEPADKGRAYGDIIDESTDPPVTSFIYDEAKIQEYIDACSEAGTGERPFRMLYPDAFTRQRIARTLTDRQIGRAHV